jgi:hypothetical protein
MKRLTQEQIDKINSLAPSVYARHEEGIFYQPSGIPVDIKEYVIYSRFLKSGEDGGSCWGHMPEPFENEEPKNRMEVLDLVLKEICPNITFMQYKGIDNLIKEGYEKEREYYGNYSEYSIKYLPLSTLYTYLDSLD